MGFGTLFIGYFFLVNISYFQFTDIIAAAIMTLGLYKLSRFCRDFKSGLYVSGVFILFSLSEIIIEALSLFREANLIAVSPYMSILRYSIIFALNIFIMRGIRAIAREVAAGSLETAARAAIYFSFIYPIAAIFSIPALGALIGKAVAFVYFAILLMIFAYVISSLFTIYKAYMQICLPEDEVRAAKPSGFDPLGKLFDRMEKSGKEYAEYKLNKQINKNKKRKK